tara:strand:+ start:1962 stop:2387 length:426 start_codon:yes stop_codon:yes gene_type:complete
VGKTDETKRKAKKARTKQSAATKHRPETRSYSLSLSLSLSLSVVVVFKADLSLFNLSLFVSCGGKQQSVDTLNKEEAKKLEHKSRGVKKHEQRNCSESALFSLFCCFLFCAFSTKPYEIIPSVRGDLLSLSTKVRFSPLLL